MSPQEALEFRQDLIDRGFIVPDGETKQPHSNLLQSTWDVHAPIEQTDGSPPLPSLATQWRQEWGRRMRKKTNR